MAQTEPVFIDNLETKGIFTGGDILSVCFHNKAEH